MVNRISLVAAFALVCLTLSGNTLACGNSYYHRVHPQVAAMQQAEKHLDVGRIAEAAAIVLGLFSKISEAKGTDLELEARARRIVALATVRNGGHWPVSEAGAQAPAEPLTWAVQQLRAAAERSGMQPRAQSDLGEALALTPSGTEEASTILEKLAGKMLITSPHAWAALARVRKAKGDTNGGWGALAECRKKALYNGTCSLEAPKKGGAVKKALGGGRAHGRS